MIDQKLKTELLKNRAVLQKHNGEIKNVFGRTRNAHFDSAVTD